MGMIKRFGALSTAVALMVMGAAQAARAGTYSVSSCGVGWSSVLQLASGETGPSVTDDCDRPEHGLYASFGGVNPTLRLTVGDTVGWRFDAPPDTSIVSASSLWNGLGDYAANDWGATE